MKILLTGYTGFVGQHILKTEPCEIMEDEFGQIPLSQKGRINKCLKKTCPDAIIHLAAQSNVAISFQNPRETFDTNFYGTLNLLECLKDLNFKGKFLFIGSGDVYGIPKKIPIDENMPLKPRNPYAVSKVAAEALCYQWSKTSDIQIVMTRSFNHIGTGQSTNFAIASFAQQIADIKLGKQKPIIEVGDLDVTRDFTDVRDVVQSYLLLLKYGMNGEVYNVCSGREVMLKDALYLLSKSAKIEIEVKSDTGKFRVNEQKRSCGSYNKLHTISGWSPKIDLAQSLEDILKYNLVKK